MCSPGHHPGPQTSYMLNHVHDTKCKETKIKGGNSLPYYIVNFPWYCGYLLPQHDEKIHSLIKEAPSIC